MVEEKASGPLRIAEIIAGIIALALGAYAIIYPGIAAATLIALLAIGLLIVSLIEFVRIFSTGISGWQRLLNAILSLIAFLLAAAVLVAPVFVGGLTLGWLVALALIFAGFAFMARGTSGMLIVGIIAAIIGFVALVNPITGVITVVALVAIGLIILGLEFIVSGLLGRWV
ncbi:MAG: DUF308 domain-containing protein [Halobacteriota archaeon]